MTPKEGGLEVQRGRLLTGEDLSVLAGLGPCELVEGKLVPMVPTGDEHGGCESNIDGALRSFVKPRKLGKVRVGEVGIYTRRDPDTVRAADAVFISNERHAKLSKKSGFLDVAPELVVEILSPTDASSAVMTKVREYLGCGVRLVWVVDPAARAVHSYRSPTDVRRFGEGDDLPGDDVLPGFSVKVASLFE